MNWIPRRPLRQYPAAREALVGVVLISMMALTTRWITGTFYEEAWSERGVIYYSATIVGGALGPWIPGETWLFMYLFPIGFFMGCAFVWLLDTYKRYQAVILWVLIGTFLVVLWGEGRLVPALLNNLTPTNGAFWLAGVLLGVQLSGVPLYQYSRGRKEYLLPNPPHEFPRAPRLVFAGIAVTLVAGFLNYHVVSPSPGSLVYTPLKGQSKMFQHFVAGVFVLGTFWKFQEYESHIRTIQIGPARSGKTAVFAGLYRYIDNNPNYDILTQEIAFDRDYVDSIGQGEFPDRNQATEKDDGPTTQWLEIPFVSSGRLFRKRLVLSTLDYPGELVDVVGPELEKEIERYVESDEYTSDSDEQWEDGRQLAENLDTVPDKKDRIVESLARLVEAADTLILTIPIDDFIQELAADDVLPGYVEAYWLRANDGEREVFGLDGERLDPDTVTMPVGEFDRLPTYNHEDHGEVSLYVVGEAGERTQPETYGDVYEWLANRYGAVSAGEDKRFVWTVTKSDLVSDQYEQAFEAVTDTTLDPETTVSDLIEADGRRIPERADAQKLFARWIETRLIETPTSWTQFRGAKRDLTGEQFVYPLWYEIVDEEPPGEDEEPKIDTTTYPTVLRGANYFLNRIKGRPFVERQTPASFVPLLGGTRRTEYVVEKMRQAYARVKSTGGRRHSGRASSTGDDGGHPTPTSETTSTDSEAGSGDSVEVSLDDETVESDLDEPSETDTEDAVDREPEPDTDDAADEDVNIVVDTDSVAPSDEDDDQLENTDSDGSSGEEADQDVEIDTEGDDFESVGADGVEETDPGDDGAEVDEE